MTITEYITSNPHSTASEIAKGVKLPKKSVISELNKLMNDGKIKQEANENKSFTYKEK